MEKEEETVVLVIEGTQVKCKKNVLIENSDYFSAMFRGSFKESCLETIEIQGVDLKSFNTILLLLWDQTYVIDDQDIHSILQAASMLQFNTIKQLCEARILEILSPSICLKIWKTAELLDISPLWLKAKCMALEEFNNICDNNQLFEISLDELCLYLGHIYLNVKSEITVFQTAMNWWYENQNVFDKDESTKVILRLLNCLDFNNLQENEIREIQSYPDMVGNPEIISVLNCVIVLRANCENLGTNFTVQQLMYARHLCNSQSRKKSEFPSLLFQSEFSSNLCPHKKIRPTIVDEKTVVIYDKFHRKRMLHTVLDCSSHKKVLHSDFCVIFDPFSNEFKNFFEIGGDKIRDLAGFKLLAYKQFVVLYGGEYLIGAGNWNCNVWTYDTFKGKWERKNMLPHGRRHFETIVVNDCLYIVGGVGKFRVVQQNLLWYDFKTDKWSSIIPLPTEDRHLKSCSFLGQLFIVYFREKRGYFFNEEAKSWRRICIVIDKEIADNMGDFAVFSDANHFYVKGKYLVKFKLENESLVVVKKMAMSDVEYEEVETVLCNNTVYTLYKCLDEHYNFFYTFESLDLETEKSFYIFENRVQENDISFVPTQYTKLFAFRYYYYLAKENNCINTPIV